MRARVWSGRGNGASRFCQLYLRTQAGKSIVSQKILSRISKGSRSKVKLLEHLAHLKWPKQPIPLQGCLIRFYRRKARYDFCKRGMSV
jgi:hypothetical protein